MSGCPLIIPSRQTVDPEPFWLMHDQSGQLLGPFDPGMVSFETPMHVARDDRSLHSLQSITDRILSEAGAGLDRLNRLLAMGHQGGLRKWGERLLWPTQTALYGGIRGGLDVPGYLGDGSATGVNGLHIDDSKNGTTVTGPSGGGGASRDGGQDAGGRGLGPGGGGGGGASSQTSTSSGGGGGGYGIAGGLGGGTNPGLAGPIANVGGIWDALLQNVYTQAILGLGGGGGGGGSYAGSGGDGGDAGDAYVEVSTATLTTVARALAGVAGANGGNGGAGGGGGSGGLSLLIAAIIAYGSGTINVAGAGGGSGDASGGVGGNGRVIQVYFDSKATLTVSGATETQYRILRSVPLGVPIQ